MVSCMLLVVDAIKSFDRVERSILDSCSWPSWLAPHWFKKGLYLAYHSQVRLGFQLAACLEEPWYRDGGYSSGLPVEYGFYCGSLRPLMWAS